CQFSGCYAVTDILAISSSLRLSNSATASSGRNLNYVPGNSPQTPARVTSSSTAAHRDGTGTPSASLWVADQVEENPSAPAASPSCNSRTIASTSSSVAARSLAASPIATRPMADCPTPEPACPL